jgi:hypothetical protein
LKLVISNTCWNVWLCYVIHEMCTATGCQPNRSWRIYQ